MRKTMTKEVTKTVVSFAIMKVVDGLPTVEQHEPIELIGNVSPEKAQKFVTKNFGAGATVFSTEPQTLTYEMAVEDFIKFATIKATEETTEEA